MEKLKPVRLSEIAELADRRRDAVSKFFKNCADDLVVKAGMRVVGVQPEAATDYLYFCGYQDFLKPSITLSANLCGGVGKTTGIYNVGVSMRRLVTRDIPIVYVDCDSQGSFTSIVFGQRAAEEDPILLDYFDKKASIKELLAPLPDNCWFVKSNLRQALIDKYTRPSEIKSKMLEFYRDIFKHLGQNAKIFQDHTPQLSGVFASSVCALHQLGDDVLKNVIIPIRADDFAIQGGRFIIQEMEDMRETFGFSNNLPVTCFFSNIDKRISTTAEAVKVAQDNPTVAAKLSEYSIRYCAEIPKAIMRHSSVFSGKNNHAAQDYQQLCKSIFFRDNKTWKTS
jgi:cellulose biosynthesis protein BcsQ